MLNMTAPQNLAYLRYLYSNQKFIEMCKDLAEEKSFEKRVESLAKEFMKHCYSESGINLSTCTSYHHKLDEEIMECTIYAANMIVSKKFGYQRSTTSNGPDLSLHL